MGSAHSSSSPAVNRPIVASGRCDPGLQDVFKSHADEMAKQSDEEMPNIVVVPNDPNGAYPVVSEHDDHPATKELMKITAGYILTNPPRKRSYCLVVEDMQTEYTQYIDYVLPNAEGLLAKFRELKLPVVWTNWSRKSKDGMYGAIDRFYGPKGIGPKQNPCYLHEEDGNQTMPSLAPQTEEELSRLIISLHLSKFADLDETGKEILFPMLQAWGVDTLVVMGAWTDDCIAATCLDAVDKYGLDCVLVKDAVATATIHGGKMVECLSGACTLNLGAMELVNHLSEHPELIAEPKAPLVGSVRHGPPVRGHATRYW